MTDDLPMTRRDPVALLRFALSSGDRPLAEALIARFSVSRTLSARTMRELAGLPPRRTVARRTYDALVVLLGLEAAGD